MWTWVCFKSGEIVRSGFVDVFFSEMFVVLCVVLPNTQLYLWPQSTTPLPFAPLAQARAHLIEYSFNRHSRASA